MILQDYKLTLIERLKCQKCIEFSQYDGKMEGIEKVKQDIENHQKKYLEDIANHIEQNIQKILKFQGTIYNFKTSIIQLLDKLIYNSNQWEENLKTLGLQYEVYSFYEELTKQSTQNDLANILDKIKSTNDNLRKKVNSTLQIFQSFSFYQNCNDILNRMDYSYDNQKIQLQEQQIFPCKLQLIDDSIEQSEECQAIVFDPAGRLMVSTNGKKIEIWNFNNGKIEKTHSIFEHTSAVSCLVFSQINNYFISGSIDKTIRMWKQQSNSQWQSSKPGKEHKGLITCIILTQKEDQLISGSQDKSIKIWNVDFNNNELKFLYSLENHTGCVHSLSLNQSDKVLVSSGHDSKIKIWIKESNALWKFQYDVTQLEKGIGMHVKFLQEDLFIWIPYNRNILCVFEFQDGKFQENIKKEVKFEKVNGTFINIAHFPIIYNEEKKIICLRHVCHIIILEVKKNGFLSVVEQLDCEFWNINGTVTNNGRYLLFWVGEKNKYNSYEIIYL
ncbi:unnamed protein product [Paramecium sonneborni]|nr:unnamed protein product [Paramecium sonneborni]